jgi:hypothetical protein
MSRRHTNRRGARLARYFRRWLVQLAGQGREEWAFYTPGRMAQRHAMEFALAKLKPRRVSVPRSLRPLLGRWIGA